MRAVKPSPVLDERTAAQVAELFRAFSDTSRVRIISAQNAGKKINLGFTIVYNRVGLTLAALGLLPPALAAAARSLPDLGILANSSRRLRQGRRN